MVSLSLAQREPETGLAHVPYRTLLLTHGHYSCLTYTCCLCLASNNYYDDDYYYDQHCLSVFAAVGYKRNGGLVIITKKLAPSVELSIRTRGHAKQKILQLTYAASLMLILTIISLYFSCNRTIYNNTV